MYKVAKNQMITCKYSLL